MLAQTAPPPATTLDPGAPLAPLPGLGVDWPDLGVRDALEAPATTTAATSTDELPRYTVTLKGVDALPAVRTGFDQLSVLRKNEGKPANAAQLDRRAREDADLLDTLLRSEGYYDATVETQVTPAPEGGRVAVVLTVEPGAQYKFGEVRLTGLEPAGAQASQLAQTYGVTVDTPVVANTVLSGGAKLRDRLMREGFPFARVAEPDVTVDREARDARLTLNVETGGKRNFGSIRLLGKDPPFDARHTQRIARFQPGQLYDQYLVDDLKRAIVATGLASQVRLETVEGVQPGTVDIATTIDPSPYRTLAGEAGYGTGEGFRVEGSWQHRNLIRPEGGVTFRGIAGTREQLLGANLRVGNFRRRDQVLNARILASREDKVAYRATSFELGGSIERQTTILWQKPWAYSLGAELIASSERNVDPARGVRIDRTFFIAALPLGLAYDGSDDLLNPTRGFRLQGRVSPELSLQGRAFGYVRSQFDASGYYPVGERIVIAGRTRIGVTAGAARNTIAPSRLFYSGGGGSVRGYGYQLIGPRDALGAPIGGRSLAEFSLEARVRLAQFGGNFGIVPFVDAGNVYSSVFPTFSGLRIGAGLGLRYYSNFGPIRIDVGTPIGRRPGESRVSVQVSLGQAF